MPNKSRYQQIEIPVTAGFTPVCYDISSLITPVDTLSCISFNPYTWGPNFAPVTSAHIIYQAYINCNTDATITWSDGEIYKSLAFIFPFRSAFTGMYVRINDALPPTEFQMSLGAATGLQLFQFGGNFASPPPWPAYIGWIPFAAGNSVLTGISSLNAGTWITIYGICTQESFNVGESCYPCFVLGQVGIRGPLGVGETSFSISYHDSFGNPTNCGGCAGAGGLSSNLDACAGTIYGPVTLTPDGSGTYRFPFPFIKSSLMVTLGGVELTPLLVNPVDQSFKVSLYGPYPTEVTAYAQITYDWTGP